MASNDLKWRVATIFLCVGLYTSVPAQTTLNGDFEHYAAIGLGHQPDPLSIRNRVRIRGSIAGSKGMIFSAARVSNALSDPETGGSEGPTRVRLLEAFVDLYTDNIDIRLGHQLVVWGQMDGVFITDLISPLDLREFLAQDFTDIRLAVPAAKVSYFLSNWSMTALVVLAPMESPIPSIDSPWFVVPELARSIEIGLEEDNLPSVGLDGLEPGLKLSYRGASTDVDLIYFNGHNRTPALSKQIGLNSAGSLRVVLRPNYYRRDVIGTRLATSIVPSTIIEVEAAYETLNRVDVNPDQILENFGPPESFSDFLVGTGQISGAVAASRTFGEAFIRIQLVGRMLTRYRDVIAPAQFTSAVTLFAQLSNRSETITGQVLVYYQRDRTYWLNPSITSKVAPGLNFSIGSHVFGGDSAVGSLSSAFSLFDDNDFVYLRATLAI